ncbi:MAG: pyridoxal phosphate enzyme YggS family [Verrucomicrobiales bacterium]|nr:pyridoxal phosphate enzyme YggS family [Verrucomicrobiales bacterium]
MSLSENLSRVRQTIADAATVSGRSPGDILLLAVSKNQPVPVINEAASLGLELFGENRVQEAKIKIGQCPGRLKWHMIGHLQSNKCRDAVHFFQMIQSVDSLSLATEINTACDKSAKTMAILLEVNVARESTKFGFKPAEVIAQLEAINALRRIEIHGLMTIAPWVEDPEKVRPLFAQLRELKLRCEEKLGAPLPHLSMGMSGDYAVAIEEGATIVRIGRSLFGERRKAL